MPNKHSEKLTCVRKIDDALRAEFDAAAKAAGSDRSAITRALWEWFVRRPGAELPLRPEPKGDHPVG